MSGMKKYRKKTPVEAIRVSKQNEQELAKIDGVLPIYLGDMFAGVWVDTLEGRLTGAKGDYVIRNIGGEVYVCKAHVFHETYEGV